MSRCRPFFLVLWSLLLLAPHAHGALGLHLQEVKPDVPARTELVVGVPRDGYPPFLFKMPTRGYAGPLKNVAARIAAEMGLSLRYVSYRTYREAGQALQKGEIDALVGVERAKLAQDKIDYIGHLGSYPRAILMANPDPNLSLARAKTLRWVCIQGFGSCQELARLGMTKVTEVVSRDEATNMVKSGAADAYLGLGPVVAKEMQSMSATMGVVRPSWVAGSALTIAIAKGDPQLTERFLQAYQRIPIRDLRLRLSADASHFKPGLLLDPDETAWLTQHNHVIKFAVAPSFGGISEIDEEGELQGYAADLITLLTANSGIRFELVPTRQWHESIELLKQQQVDLIPLMTALASRRDFASFTSPFLRINSYVVARQGTPPLSSLTALQGRRIVGVTDSHEASLIARYGAEIVEVDSDSDLLAALDSGLADYALLTMTSLGQQAIQGFSNKYQVVFSSPQLALPVSMGIARQQPELTRIMNKLLQSITDEEWRVLEQRWLNVSVNQGPDYGVMFRGLAIGGGLLLCGGLLVLAWNWSLRRQINQRKMAERLLNEQLQFVETLLESLPSMVALLDRDQRFIQCNQAYRDTFMGQENIHALDQLPFMTRAVKDMVLAEERTIWQTGQGMQGAGMATRADGSLLHVAYAKRPYHDPDGNMRGVLTVLTDLTHIKEAEARARHAETRLAQITDSMPGIVFQYVWQDEGKGRFLYISEGVESILGINREQVFATTSAGELLAASPAVCQALIKQVAHHARTLTPVDLELISKNGPEERILQLRGNFQLGEKGALLLNGVIQDITSLKRQQNELQEARASAEQAMQARSRFLASMSHELRTPISGMHGMLELLQMSQLNDDQHDMVRNVVSSTHNLLYLVNDILDFSKIEAGQLQLHYQTSRLQTVICDAIRGHATLAHGRGLKVTLVWGPLMPDHADIDAVRIGQVISNLLSNAVKFTTKGEIRILVNYQHGQLAISVSDTGIGIAQEKQGLLFTPFEQVESDINRRFGGSGLGLAICLQLVQKMSGELSVTSKVGEGACFHFTVPLLQPLWDKPPLTGTEWWFCSTDSHLEAAMVRLGATLRHLDVSQLHRAQQGLLLADQSCLEQALGREWQQWLKHGALKGIITSSNEALRGRVEGEP
ncbi:MAG: ATP-binding protein, partial [Aeromonas sp.]